jgi:hypothetical protein
MHCPECHSANEPGAAACTTCGLILLTAAPKRRSDDLATQRRRSSDSDTTHCPFCEGTIASRAVRCRHCAEVVNDDFFRERAQRLRGRVNYASWVAYIFGLAALLIFRPVGLFSIAVGLLLSIVYYAIPVEPQPKKKKFGAFLRKQFKLERVSIPIPNLKNKKLVFVGTPLIAALVGYSANAFLLQEPMNDILSHNSSFSGMQVSAHYEYWVVPGVVVFDLRHLGVKQTPIDVHTALLEFAKKLKSKRYSRVDLSYRGDTKFSIDGASFTKLGEEYAKRNFDFVLYKLPRLLQPSVDSTTSDRNALVEFHRHWYGDDAMTAKVSSGQK